MAAGLGIVIDDGGFDDDLAEVVVGFGIAVVEAGIGVVETLEDVGDDSFSCTSGSFKRSIFDDEAV